jgi:DNA-binding response OmpR family regulator
MVRKELVLVVDDEPAIVRLVRAKLQADGYAIVTAGDGETGLTLLEDERPDLVVLDVMMPGIDGFETLRRIRASSRVPVIMLTARSGDRDKVRGLDLGADDYLAKPFNPDELSARVAAVLRRTGLGRPVGGQPALRYPGLEIDLERRRVVREGAEVKLSKTEWELLAQLAGNAGRVMTHAELLTRIWGPDYRDEAHYLRTWVSRLRAKLEVAGVEPPITTFPGIGYRLEAPDADPPHAAASSR